MTELNETADEQLRSITECPICINVFTDPRILPCIHTFCFECLSRTSEATQKKQGDKMPCPLCRTKFRIPKDGVNGVQKNFFMKNLLQYKTMLQTGSATIFCDICSQNVNNEGQAEQIPEATKRCVECQDYFCNICANVHTCQLATKDHHMLNIGRDMKAEKEQLLSMESCITHIDRPLDYYCRDCKQIVCVLCFAGRHKSHNCKDLTTVDKNFRKAIKQKAMTMSNFMDEMLLVRNNEEMRKADFLHEVIEKENEIYDRNQELKNRIDRQTISLLDELSEIKSNRLLEIENEMEGTERWRSILSSFEDYCTELRSMGSAKEIRDSFDQSIGTADEIEKEHKEFIGCPRPPVKLTFRATDFSDVTKKFNNNLVGSIKATRAQMENVAMIVGLNVDQTITNDVIKVNLRRSNEVSVDEQIPTEMRIESFAAVYSNTIFVTGTGDDKDEIWKYTEISGWKKCASLVQGRCRHSAAFINEMLYICGGFDESTNIVLDSVEAYNAITDKCTTVGKLRHRIQNSGNCVPFKSSLFIFGGYDNDGKLLNCFQVYNTKQNTCRTKPMPHGHLLMRAVLWNTSVIMIGNDTCFIFDIKRETWRERKPFKTSVFHFGLIVENERIFVMGGGTCEEDEDGRAKWKCRDDVRYVPLRNFLLGKPIEWKVHGKLPQPGLVSAYANMHCCI